jgi:hypothetical protein
MTIEPCTESAGREHFDVAAPLASSLVEALRAFSYELPTALADLVDNSITATASRVWIDFFWGGDESVISITDDGRGMSEPTLIEAMRPGSQNPLTARNPADLGRFGLGLKTASFSQCRRLTVRSKTERQPPATRCWDLDHIARVNEWQLLRAGDIAAEAHFKRLAPLESGTCVVWQKLDRLVAGHQTQSDSDQQHFLRRVDAVREHIGMVFHRLLRGSQQIRIYLNDRLIIPWDPFLESEPATQGLPPTHLHLRGSTIEVQPFVLPHHNKISQEQFEKAGGPRGWNAHQGFFVYRNSRLLVPGGWLGLGWPNETQHRLARIRVDLPNSLDEDWAIDVTKSRALPPPALRDDLHRIAVRTRVAARLVYSHRGARLIRTTDAERILLWEPAVHHGKTFYRLNREHTLVRQALATSNDGPAITALLRLIEETVPSAHIAMQSSDALDALPEPFDGATAADIEGVMRAAHRSYVAAGYAPGDATDRLRTIWPFELFPELLQTLSESEQ